MTHPTRRGILVDLDGTLVDTFPDLLRCAQAAVVRHSLQPINVSEAALRHGVSGGARALLKVLTGQDVADNVVAAMLDIYAAMPVQQSKLFAGAESWFALGAVAVVTNKSRRFAAAVVSALCPPATTLVCPEDAGAPKPDPAPILLGLRLLGVAPENAVYVGDDMRDYQAATMAGVPFVAALYGYGGDFSHGLPPHTRAIRSPVELAQVLGVP